MHEGRLEREFQPAALCITSRPVQTKTAMKGSFMSFVSGVKTVSDEAPNGPLFRVGEIWRLADFHKQLGGDRRTITRMRKAGLKVWKPGKKALVLIDSLAALIASDAVLPKPEKPERKKPKKRRP